MSCGCDSSEFAVPATPVPVAQLPASSGAMVMDPSAASPDGTVIARPGLVMEYPDGDGTLAGPPVVENAGGTERRGLFHWFRRRDR